MSIKNFLDIQPVEEICHDGKGKIKIVNIFDSELAEPLNFVHYTVLPPGTSIGSHTHGNNQELYIILEGSGVTELDGMKSPVKKGDVLLNKPFGIHSLYNTSDSDELKILVMEVNIRDSMG
ncbi:MAG: cupin domain-containing protein [Treponema sp.]|nr:cupin domain-containing protein [Treponema sp.]